MQRYNIFNQIHKALKVLLYDTASLLSHTEFDNPEQAEAAMERINQVIHLFEKHSSKQNSTIFPLVEQYEPAVIDAFRQEHKQEHALSQNLKGYQLAFLHAIAAEARNQMGKALSNSFTGFMLSALQHMTKEEAVLNSILWRYYSDSELIIVNKKIAASVPEEDLSIVCSWMMKALTDQEIITWLRDAERHAHNTVFRILFTAAEGELDETRFRKIREGLTEGIMIAS